MRVALDTKVLAYAEGVDTPAQQDAAMSIISKLRVGSVVLPVQAVGELFNVLFRKGRRTREEARSAVVEWCRTFTLAESSMDVMSAALELACAHRLSIWDAVILAAADQERCRVLLSQDMQDGFRWRGVTIVNPFANAPHPLLSECFV